MTGERRDEPDEKWERIKQIFGAALEREGPGRVAFLDEACAGDPDVRREVESLLEAHESSETFLDQPVTRIAAHVSPGQSTLSDGQTVGTYRIVRMVGRGGMATVYLARDLRHRRSVALKVLHRELAHAVGTDRFLREIEVAANLSHPHILPLFDSGEAAGLLYYVMPYIEGESLRDRLKRETQLSVDDALQIARQVADALAYAHAHGVVHRDIKPENIMLSGGHALVTDFGIARAISDSGDDNLTGTGIAVGTVAYMSPEQASGARQLDGRTDEYSLACVVYELLLGEPPYAGPTAQAMIVRRLSEPVPSIRRMRPAVPVSVDKAVTRALSPMPADRFSTITELATALQVDGTASGEDAAQPAVPALRAPSRRALLMASLVALGLAAAIGVIRWRQSHAPADEAPHRKVLAVLPFENLGDSADSYFTDGVANDVRSKLSQIAGLAVIARASSNQYRQSTKPPQQIARELGADYLLTATVQWQKVPGGTSRVRVTPELVDVREGQAPEARWDQQFDADLTEVFQVQADIAGQVAHALDIALGEGDKRHLASQPTRSLPAYDAFLRGEAASQGMAAFDPPSLRQAVAAYEQAVALDSTFIDAWERIAEAQSVLYFNGEPSTAKGEAARHAVERVRALAPDSPEAHQAMGRYYYLVVGDNRRSFVEDSIASALAPGNVEPLLNLGWDELTLGRAEAARVHLEEAVRLDPRAGLARDNLGYTLLCLRRYAEAERAYDQALALNPANLQTREFRTMVALAQGDLDGARAIVRAAPKDVDPTSLVAYLANYVDLGWVLDRSQQDLLLRLTPSAFDGNRGIWGWVLAQTYALRGDSARARAYADSALSVLRSQLEAAPENAELHLRVGLAQAYVGDKDEAIRNGKRGVELMPVSRNIADGAWLQHQLVRIYLVVGEPEKALDNLEPLLKVPCYLTPGWLRIDPNLSSLRRNRRFERLVRGT